MPRVNPNQSDLPKNPAKIFAQWKDPGIFVYYDKELEKNIELPSNFTFIVLDEFATVKGWNDPTSSGIYSNEVRSVKNDKLTVKSFKGGLIAEGLYGQIHDSIVAAGGKYCSSVYIAYKDGDELKIGNIRFVGSSLGAWFEFKKENKNELYTGAIQLIGKLEAKKGATKYYIPKFKVIAITPETDDKAGELQRELMEYHKEYFGKTVPSNPDDLEGDLNQVKSEVEQQKEVMDRNLDIPDDAYVTKAIHDETASFQEDNSEIQDLPF